MTSKRHLKSRNSEKPVSLAIYTHYYRPVLIRDRTKLEPSYYSIRAQQLIGLRMARVLVVEDDGLQGYELKQAIENRTNAAVWVAPSVSRAFTALAIDRIDFAVLDVQVLDGHTFGLARYLMRADVPFAFLSASRRNEVPVDLTEYPFLSKPLHYPALHAAMQPALSAARKARPVGSGFLKRG